MDSCHWLFLYLPKCWYSPLCNYGTVVVITTVFQYIYDTTANCNMGHWVCAVPKLPFLLPFVSTNMLSFPFIEIQWPCVRYETQSWLLSIGYSLFIVAHNDSVRLTKTLQCTLRHYSFYISVFSIANTLCTLFITRDIYKAEAESVPLWGEMMTKWLMIVRRIIKNKNHRIYNKCESVCYMCL